MLLFPHKMMLCLSLLSFVLSGVHVLLMLFVFIYWYATRFPFQMMFMLFNSNTTGVTANSSGVHLQFLVGSCFLCNAL